MKYITTLAGQEFEIEIDAEDRITVNGPAPSIDLTSIPGQPGYSLLVNGRSYEAYVRHIDTGLEVLLQGRLYIVDVEDERTRKLRGLFGGQVLQGGELILRTPMPGLIVAVPAIAGQAVAKGQDLVVLESMKMQNELKAPRDGVIGHVSVRVGDKVDQNQVLLTLD